MWSLSLFLLWSAVLALASDVKDCSCGFYDSETGQNYTDATIVYFNETETLPDDFYIQAFHHKREWGWNTLYRTAAIPENVKLANSSYPSSDWNSRSLQLFVDPTTPNHLVNAGSIESMRQDMLFASVRAYMRGGHSYIGGSAMSMIMELNRSSGFHTDILNTNEIATARVTTLESGEYAGPQFGVNYSVDPWEYMEVRTDWTKKFLNFTVAHNKSRIVKSKSTIPTEPLPLVFRHYSTGDANFMQGPPINRSEANVAWIRAFFNSSLSTKAIQKEYNKRCNAQPKCDVDDITLRGATSYSAKALIPWKEPPSKNGWGIAAAIVCSASAVIGVVCLVNVFFKRQPWKTMFDGTNRYEPAELDLGAGLTSPYIPNPLRVTEDKKPSVSVVPLGEAPIVGRRTTLARPLSSGPTTGLRSSFARPLSGRRTSAARPFSSGPALDTIASDLDEMIANAPVIPRRSSAALARASSPDPPVQRRSSLLSRNLSPEASANRRSQRLSRNFSPDAPQRNSMIITSRGLQSGPRTATTASGREEEDQVTEMDPAIRRRSAYRSSRYGPNQMGGPQDFEASKPKTSVEVQESGYFQNGFSFGREDPSSLAEIVGQDFQDMFQPGANRRMSLFAQSRQSRVMSGTVDDDLDQVEGTVRDVRDRRSSVFQSVTRSVVRLASVAQPVEEAPAPNPTNYDVGKEDQIDMRRWNTQQRQSIATIDPPFNALQGQRRPTMVEAVPIPAIDLPLPSAKAKEKRVNYLAGLVAFSCLAVTITHFCLTFVPYAGGLGIGQHYKSETAARWFATPFIMDPIWLGPFFVTSCRFLVGGFFKKGDLAEIAKRMLLRTPRMILPALIVATLEYFFIEEGLTFSLNYLPSVSWSSWPYVIDYNNFGQYINDILELAYLIPNAAPQIVDHYCVGILWTVPVQLQFSFISLLAAVIIKDITNVYKRMLVYSVAIITGWYALSWGACFWSGVLLADLQATYNVSKWLQARPKIWYPLAIFLWAVALACPTMSLLEDRLDIPTLIGERNIHPDIITGQPLVRTPRAAYPLYYEPRLNTLVFAVSLQFLLETSKWFQAFFSLYFWQIIFPHAYTVYLIHGFVWWSLGSYIVVSLGTLGIPYWANMLVNGIVCYTVLALATMIISPLTEMVSAAACRNLERWVTQASVPSRPTLSPFPHNLFLGRTGDGKDDGSNLDEESYGGSSNEYKTDEMKADEVKTEDINKDNRVDEFRMDDVRFEETDAEKLRAEALSRESLEADRQRRESLKAEKAKSFNIKPDGIKAGDLKPILSRPMPARDAPSSNAHKRISALVTINEASSGVPSTATSTAPSLRDFSDRSHDSSSSGSASRAGPTEYGYI